MKKTFPFLMAAFFLALIIGCTQEKEVEVSMSDVQLIKIDTIQRYPNASEKILTWRSDDNINYISFAPIETYYPLGARMKVMVRK